MDGARGDEDAVARAGLERVHHILAAACPDRCGQRVAIDARVKPGVDAAAGRGIDHIPGFRLAQVGRHELGRPCVVGVHLHGEIATGIEKLEEQRKDGAGCMPSQQLRAPLAHQFTERRAGQRAGRHDALVGAAIDEFP